LRDLYLLDEKVVFLNHGSFGACPKPVFERYQAWQLELERQPVEFLGRRHDTLMKEALDSLGEFIGTSGDNLIFVPNATNGLNMVARSLKLGAEDEILTTNHEYGALDLTWKYISRETGCKIVAMPLPDGFYDVDEVVEAIWKGVTENTKVIFMSHITSPTGLILPAKEICKRAKEAGIMTIIDGAHVTGHLPLNLDEFGADFYSGNCHKWLSAPKGSAFVYVKPEYHDMIDPLTISWGWDGDTLFERTSWQGTREIASFLTVPAAIQFQREHNWQEIQQQCHDLAIETMNRICKMTGLAQYASPEFFGQMSTSPLPADTDLEKLKSYLYDNYCVEVPLTTLGERKFVRVSIQAYNTRNDADTLLEGLQAFYSA